MNFLRLFLLFMFLFGSAQAQKEGEFKFVTRVADHENQWVVLPANPQEGVHMVGFLYVDPTAGCTLQLGGTFRIDKKGRLKMQPDGLKEKVMIKSRLQGNMPVAPLTLGQLKELGLPAVPDWLAYYKDDASPAMHRVNWGRAYNHIGACEKALEYLEPAYLEIPDNEKLLFELSYAYNALHRASDAQRVLGKALEKHPKNFYLQREYAYVFLISGQCDAAVGEYRKCLELCPSDNLGEKAEVAMNLAQALMRTKAKDEAQEWLTKAREWAPEGSAVSEFFKNQGK